MGRFAGRGKAPGTIELDTIMINTMLSGKLEAGSLTQAEYATIVATTAKAQLAGAL